MYECPFVLQSARLYHRILVEETPWAQPGKGYGQPASQSASQLPASQPGSDEGSQDGQESLDFQLLLWALGQE